ncbi:MAG: MOSC domain-containing protein [Fluviicoccus sp.]|uniref:MOSC domain-containing protein n=1 Tax=Fluviicoccus sp. TaxID=2003552 RepID=UPI00271F5297|nr:MOSC domain-containing protein [Fluviicoccus sp.]MDO8329055.1 MOSC domain-containing protein [Fluviicoccus sp.]
MKLIGIAVRPARGEAMVVRERADISVEEGLDGDYVSRQCSRQVSLLSAESWRDVCRDAGVDLHWHTRRANLLVQDYVFGMADLGRVVVIGDVRLRISRETMPCRKMDMQFPGLQEIIRLDWRGGVCCRVLRGGVIAVGDEIRMEEV